MMHTHAYMHTHTWENDLSFLEGNLTHETSIAFQY